MNIYELSGQFRRELLAREDASVSRMIAAWMQVEARLKRELLDLLEVAAANNWTASAIASERHERLRILLLQVAHEVGKLAGMQASEVSSLQSDAANMALSHAERLVQARLPAETVGRIGRSWHRVSAGAVEALVGALGDGSPLTETFARFGPAAAEATKEALIQGIAMGRNPRHTATMMQVRAIDEGVLGPADPTDVLGAWRGLNRETTVIARNESLRAYRGATAESFQANSDVVMMYEWCSARDTRTCPICWAMDGTLHRLDEVFGTHVQCRCSQLPVTQYTRPRATGEQAFIRLSDDAQLKILGPAKFKMYSSGEIQLRDLVVYSEDPKWGPQRNEANIALARAQAVRRQAA